MYVHLQLWHRLQGLHLHLQCQVVVICLGSVFPAHLVSAITFVPSLAITLLWSPSAYSFGTRVLTRTMALFTASATTFSFSTMLALASMTGIITVAVALAFTMAPR